MRLSEFTDTTPVLIPTVEQPIEMSVADVLRWVAPDAPPFEAMKFLMACRMAQVNPFLGEAHLVDHGGRYATIIDKSGYLKRAQAHPAYEGHEAGIIAQEFDPATKHRGPLVDLVGSFLPPGYIVVGGWARVHRRGVRRPVEIRVSIQEYNRGQGTWKTLTCTMIRKVALVQALRESGLISSGWYAEGEVGPGPAVAPGQAQDGPDDFDAATREAIDVEFDAVEDATLDPGLLARLVELIRDVGMTDEQVRAALHRRGVSRLAELSNIQAHDLVVRLSGQARRQDPGRAIAGLMPGLLPGHGAAGDPAEAADNPSEPGADGHADADASDAPADGEGTTTTTITSEA